jgi:dienelactone hydrolase
MIRTGPSDSVRAWVVYPERSSKAPVGRRGARDLRLSTWVRGVADQLAADGFIAIAPGSADRQARAHAGDGHGGLAGGDRGGSDRSSPRTYSARSPRSDSTECPCPQPRSATASSDSAGAARSRSAPRS